MVKMASSVFLIFRNGQHYLIPEVSSNAADNTREARIAKSKLQNLSNVAFEAFAMDVYDEVDR